MLSDDNIIAQNPSAISAEIDDEIVFMDVESGRYFSLDAIAHEIWKTLESPTRVDALIDDLSASFNVGEKTIRADVTAFLDKMLDAKLIQTVQPS